VAYNAEINVSVRNLNQVQELESSLSNVSRTVNSLNKVGASSGARTSTSSTGRNSNAVKSQREVNRLKRVEVDAEQQIARSQGIRLRKLATSMNSMVNKSAALLDRQTPTAQSRRLPSASMLKGDSRGIQRLIPARITDEAKVKGSGFTATSSKIAENFENRISAARKRSDAINKGLIGSEKQRNRQIISVNRAIDKQNRSTRRQSANLVKLADSFGKLGAGVGKFQEGLTKTRGPGGGMLGLPSAQMLDTRVKATGQAGGFARNIPRFRMPKFDRGSALSSAAISGGFPLLFGQGVGPAAVGALGGGIGGGLGGQMGGFAGGIAATAALTAITNAVSGVAKLGQAFNKLNPDIDTLVSSLGIAGTEEERRIRLIEQAGGKQAALNAVTQKMNEILGTEAVEKIKRFGEASQEIGNAFAELMLKMQAAIAPFLEKIAEGISGFTGSDANRVDRLSAGVPDATIRGAQGKIRDLEAEKSGAGAARVKAIGREIAGLNKIINQRKQEIATLKEADLIRSNNNKLISIKLKDLEKENKLNNAIIAGKGEEALIEQQISDILKELKIDEDVLTEGQERRIKNTVTENSRLKDQAAIVKEIKDAYEGMTETVTTDLKEGIKGLIKGTSTLGDMLNTVADRFLDIALNQALMGNPAGTSVTGGIFGAIAGIFKANGGPVKGGSSYIVGEKGPELFTPGRSGAITPNNKLGGGGSTSVVVNVDASGTDVQGDEAQAKELGTLISVAVQGELVKQQRPGGLLASVR